MKRWCVRVPQQRVYGLYLPGHVDRGILEHDRRNIHCSTTSRIIKTISRPRRSQGHDRDSGRSTKGSLRAVGNTYQCIPDHSSDIVVEAESVPRTWIEYIYT